ncbi:MAG TPA: hypothetical protein VN366_12100 [Feifaniaceae bacterium]|nr:hypothetical protein [Feifaniaceae bacterium]
MKRTAAFAAFVFCILLVIFSRPAINAAQEGLQLWWDILLPTLFPFFASATLIERTGALQLLANLFFPLSKRLNVSHYALPLVLLGGISGYPSGARLSGMLLESGSISEKEAERLGTVCTLCSPMFLMGAVAGGMFQNTGLFWPLAISYYGGALLLGVMLRLLKPIRPSPPGRAKFLPPDPFYKALPRAVGDGMVDTLKVGGSVVFFLVLAEVLSQLNVLDVLGLPLDALFFNVPGDSPAQGFLLGLMEMTGGCSRIANAGLPLIYSVPLCSFLIGFGGLSVMVQAMAFVPFQKPARYLFYKLIHGAFSGLIAYAILTLFPSAAETLASSQPPYYVVNALTGLALLFSCALGLATSLLLALLFGKKERRSAS